MRRVVIIVSVIVVAAVVLYGAYYAFLYLGASEAMKTGKLEGDARTNFVNSAIQSCEAGFKGNYPKTGVESYCTCIANVSADIITPDEMKSLAMTGHVPDSLGKKLDAPIKQCLKDSGLLPAQ
ncbi:MAG TPA: hypothetical protein VHQ39_06170 [Dongiaceae bacterium]|jgi:hypothetical protein|nr:hypothetical protein [Dongiaceae bacterium]